MAARRQRRISFGGKSALLSLERRGRNPAFTPIPVPTVRHPKGQAPKNALPWTGCRQLPTTRRQESRRGQRLRSRRAKTPPARPPPRNPCIWLFDPQFAGGKAAPGGSTAAASSNGRSALHHLATAPFIYPKPLHPCLRCPLMFQAAAAQLLSERQKATLSAMGMANAGNAGNLRVI